MGAEYIEKANAIVISSEDLFPSGTVTLHNMQLLSDNSIDDTIMRAASLTDSLSSPLAPIFKKIAGTAGDFVMPDSDTVKYEDKMGFRLGKQQAFVCGKPHPYGGARNSRSER